MLAGIRRRYLIIMKQDKGIKKVVIDTGKLVETTGEMLLGYGGIWIYEVKHKNGHKHWYHEKELDDYIS